MLLRLLTVPPEVRLQDCLYCRSESGNIEQIASSTITLLIEEDSPDAPDPRRPYAPPPADHPRQRAWRAGGATANDHRRHPGAGDDGRQVARSPRATARVHHRAANVHRKEHGNYTQHPAIHPVVRQGTHPTRSRSCTAMDGLHPRRPMTRVAGCLDPGGGRKRRQGCRATTGRRPGFESSGTRPSTAVTTPMAITRLRHRCATRSGCPAEPLLVPGWLKYLVAYPYGD